ncbi:hypothetical protein [Pontixanthobacter sp.]|uniref:hypothetical protein n=1 Tax=Pontixanthobacter sp. TaxID=2792078 RepID=UPI003C79B231
MLLDKMFESLDRKLFQFVTRIKPLSELEGKTNSKRRAVIEAEIGGHYLIRAHMREEEAAFHLFGIIDQKAGAMLTHISVMIAANALLLGTDTSLLLDVGSVTLLCAFILVALLSLRLLRFWATLFPTGHKNDENHENSPASGGLELSDKIKASLREEVFYRTRLYRFALNSTTMLTAFSAILMLGYGVELSLPTASN